MYISLANSLDHCTQGGTRDGGDTTGVEGCDGGNRSGGQGAIVVEDDVKKNVMMICGPPFIEYDSA